MNIKDSISALYDMELNNYIMTNTINTLNDKISCLGRTGKIQKPYKQSNDFSIGASMGFGAIIGSIAVSVILIIYYICINSGFFGVVAALFDGIIQGVIFGAPVGLIGGAIAGTILKSKNSKRIERNYQKDQSAYNDNVKRDNNRVNGELRQRKILESTRDALIARRNEANQKLQRFYSAVGIDQKYRSLIPIGYMNEFIRLNISNHLDGADGLYYLVRQELRADQFQFTLEEISYKLDQVLDRQHEIYFELKNANVKINTMINETIRASEIAAKNNQLLQTAVNNTSIAAYNSQRIATELQFQNFLLYTRY